VYSQEEITASKAAWADWEKRGRALPLPDVPEYLSLQELAGRYGEYVASDGTKIPVLPGHVRVIDFVCPVCHEQSAGFLEYSGKMVCSKECAAIWSMSNESIRRFSDEFIKRAVSAREARERIKYLERELEQLRSVGGQ
jgi:hypothetical protein